MKEVRYQYCSWPFRLSRSSQRYKCGWTTAVCHGMRVWSLTPENRFPCLIVAVQHISNTSHKTLAQKSPLMGEAASAVWILTHRHSNVPACWVPSKRHRRINVYYAVLPLMCQFWGKSVFSHLTRWQPVWAINNNNNKVFHWSFFLSHLTKCCSVIKLNTPCQGRGRNIRHVKRKKKWKWSRRRICTERHQSDLDKCSVKLGTGALLNGTSAIRLPLHPTA